MVEVHRQHFLFIWEHGEDSLDKFFNKLVFIRQSLLLSTHKKQLIF